jgi:hypothetical protein
VKILLPMAAGPPGKLHMQVVQLMVVFILVDAFRLLRIRR